MARRMDDMGIHFPQPAGAAVAGMGRVTLDVIISPGRPPRAQAGGTCGNVLANLAYLGWRAVPIARLGDDGPGRLVVANLAEVGVDVSLVRLVPGERTPVVAHHVPGAFSQSCPFCGAPLPDYDPMPPSEAEAAVNAAPACRAFVFDQDSPGALLAARHFREAGALVVWEPNYAGPEVDLKGTLAVAHVVKCSEAQLPGFADVLPAEVPLVVETRGGRGLGYRRGGAWGELPAFPVAVVRDAAGAGDWVTAGMVHALGQAGVAGLLAAGEGRLRDCLRLGQALGAYNCGFEGARGASHAVPRDQLLADVAGMLAGAGAAPETGAAPAFPSAGPFCPCRAG